MSTTGNRDNDNLYTYTDNKETNNVDIMSTNTNDNRDDDDLYTYTDNKETDRIAIVDNKNNDQIDPEDDDLSNNMRYRILHSENEINYKYKREREQNYTRAMSIGLLFCIAWIFSIMTDQYQNRVIRQTFIEQDPGLSYPYVDKQHVPSYLLYIISFAIPSICLLFSYVLYFLATRTKTTFGSSYSPDAKFKRTKVDIKNIKKYVTISFLGFVSAFLFTRATTNVLKILFGEPRPSFFGICNYQGFRDALNSGNYTEYYNLTRFGQYGDIKNCREENSYMVDDAFMSFPSGHASLTFSGIVYASLILFMFKERSQLHYMFAVFVSGGLFTLASWVGFTRVEDYMHKSSDVFAGAFIGSVIAYCVYVFVRDMFDQFKMTKAFNSEEFANRNMSSLNE
jgi:membrane-associated phospholipid phosphatase